jgi:surfactin synthase thioesterase subunit
MTVWLQRQPSAAATARVFCIPHAGCGASVFGNWPAERAGVEFLPVELPGRLTRFTDRMPGTFQELAAALLGALQPYLDVPFAFFGHCWSALAAYEATAQLQAAGGPDPARLFVSSQVAPQDGPVGRMLDMDDAALTAELEETIRDQGNTPHPQLVAVYLNVLRADIETSRRYVVPAPLRLRSPITAIGWSDDTDVRPDRMSGWAACGETAFTVLAGHHHRFLDAPPELLDLLVAGTTNRGGRPALVDERR